MKILLIGEASNLHWTLAEGLRANGHTVTVVSHGSHWLTTNEMSVSFVEDMICFIPYSTWRILYDISLK